MDGRSAMFDDMFCHEHTTAPPAMNMIIIAAVSAAVKRAVNRLYRHMGNIAMNAAGIIMESSNAYLNAICAVIDTTLLLASLRGASSLLQLSLFCCVCVWGTAFRPA